MSTALDLQMPLPTGSLEAYISAVNSVPMLSLEKEQALATHFRENGDIDAARLAGLFDQIGDHFDIILDHGGLARAPCLTMVIRLRISIDQNSRSLGFCNMRPGLGDFCVGIWLGIH